jgi:hypothetical protein
MLYYNYKLGYVDVKARLDIFALVINFSKDDW